MNMYTHENSSIIAFRHDQHFSTVIGPYIGFDSIELVHSGDSLVSIVSKQGSFRIIVLMNSNQKQRR